MFTIKTPNILLIFADQLGALATGCGGNPIVRTPVLDQFAQENQHFVNAFTTAPVCTPYRGALFTGRYPSQTGVLNNGYHIPASEITIADCFNNAGYKTVYTGKWHLSGPPCGNMCPPQERRAGFKDMIAWESHHVDHWAGRIWDNSQDNELPMPGHETDALTDIACSKLTELANQETPFFMTLAFQAPHPPCSPPDEYRDLYRDRKLKLRDNVDFEAWYNRPEWQADYSQQEFCERYFGEITHLDHCFGKILSHLKQQDLNENTIVIFTADHGEMAGSHGRFGKYVFNEEAIRIPLAVRIPGETATIHEQMVSTIDIMPTLLDLANIAKPDSLEGTSLYNDTPYIFMDYYKGYAVRSKTHKLTTDRELNPLEFYDLEKDHLEQNNLIEEISMSPERNNLLQELKTWHKEITSRQGDIKEAQQQLT